MYVLGVFSSFFISCISWKMHLKFHKKILPKKGKTRSISSICTHCRHNFCLVTSLLHPASQWKTKLRKKSLPMENTFEIVLKISPKIHSKLLKNPLPMENALNAQLKKTP